MNRREQGFLLLTSHLGDPVRRVLTMAQLRTLANRVPLMKPGEAERDMTVQDLTAIGYDRTAAQRILDLLAGDEQLQWYVRRGAKKDCYPITRVSDGYPQVLRKRLGLEAPGCLWAKGDASLLELPAVALVGSRDLLPENREFARQVGRRAAQQGFVLVSGNARGADRAAQNACLEAGGKVISVVADSLEAHMPRENLLYLSEDGYDLPFSSLRALSRNRVIHCLGSVTFVAQSDLEKGGTWDGTAKNLRHGWSSVYGYEDGSPAMEALSRRGAVLIQMDALSDFLALQKNTLNFIDQ